MKTIPCCPAFICTGLMLSGCAQFQHQTREDEPHAVVDIANSPTSSPKSNSTGGSSVVAAHWTKVSSRPPTFYPRGVSADCPTDYQCGDWVATGDAVGTRFFIPVACPGRIPRQALMDEALSVRRPGEPRQPSGDETRKLAPKEVIGRAAMTPILMVGWLVSFGRWPGYDVDWREEWKSSKQPPDKKRGRPPELLTEDGKTKPQTHYEEQKFHSGPQTGTRR